MNVRQLVRPSYFDEIKFCRSYDALTSGLIVRHSKYDGRAIEH